MAVSSHEEIDAVSFAPSGEFGELLLSSGGLREGEAALSVSTGDIVQMLESVATATTTDPVGREYALTALMKLSTRLPDQAQRIAVRRQLQEADKL